MDDHIEHVVVMMLENRSFDHFLGAGYPRFDGVNPARRGRNRSKSSTWYEQQPHAQAALKPDPPHDTDSVLRQIGRGGMSGFVSEFERSSRKAKHKLDQVMAYFRWGDLPVLHELADNFCVCDRWFSSVPGPTWTNRFFVHSGTSLGWVKMPHLPIDWNVHDYRQTTVYDQLNAADRSWRIYYGDIPQSLLLANQRSLQNMLHYQRMSEFERDIAREGDRFPDYVFIEPDYFWPGQNDQHPPSSVHKGEVLLARVYNAIRGNAALWESTLLVVTWDEHGGFYDHVSPPAAVSPDGLDREDFAFNRYGVRVPTLLISQWVKPGVYTPPDPGSPLELDHTSILRYLTDKFGLGPLGDRTSSAASFSGALSSVANPKTPEHVEPPTLEEEAVDTAEEIVLNANQAGLLDFAESLEKALVSSSDDVSRRVTLAAQDLRTRIGIAKERLEAFLDMARVQVPAGRA